MLIRSLGSYKVLALLAALAAAALVLGLAIKANAQETGSSSSAPTIQSDQADYPPGGAVTLTGSGWQPGESVHIFVNDDVGNTWSRDVDVTADDSGNITDQFNLPDWFVAQYSVKATGAQSGEATTSFTDASLSKIQGKSNPACSPGGSCDPGGWQGSKLTGWKELDEIPLRLKDLTKGGPYQIVIPFDHFQPSSGSPGIQDLYGWTPSSGVTLVGTPQLTKSGSANDKWEYTVTVNVDQNATNPVLEFKGRLAAGAHSFTGASLQISGSDIGGTQQIQQPEALPGKPDLFVDKTGDTTAAPNSTINYTLNYRNNSSSVTAIGPQLIDELPSGMTYVSGCSTSCTVVGNFVTWDLPNLAPGATGSKSLQVSIGNANFGDTFTDTARIRSAQDDANSTDNNDTLTTTVSFNRNPDPVDDSLTTNEDNANSVNVLTNDTDQDGDTLSVTGKTDGTNGTVDCTSAGVCTYTPNANFNGSDSFTYTVSDGHTGGTATGTVNVTVSAVNDAPVAHDDTASTDEDTDLVISDLSTLTANDEKGAPNENDQNLTVDQVSNAVHGTVSLLAGEITFTPEADYNGTDASFDYRVCDDGSTGGNPDHMCDTGTVDVTVNPVADAPVANDDAATTPEDTPANIDVLANDSDVDSANLTTVKVSDPAHGSVTHNADGSFTYNPAADFNGTDTFTYKVNDGSLDSNPATVTITINGVNDEPQAKDLTGENKVTTDEDTAKLITLEASDVDNNALSYKVASLPTNGKLYNGDPSDPNNEIKSADLPATLGANQLTYKPNADYNGSDSFTYKANDGQTDSNVATVDITINPVNDEPVANDDNAGTTPEETPITIPASQLLGNDSAGPANENDQTLTISAVSNGQHGQPNLNNDGSVTFTPATDYNGLASFDYTVCDDGTPQECFQGTAIVKVTVSAVNDAPVAVDDADNTTDEDTATSIDVVANDTDVDNANSELSVSSFDHTSAHNGTVSLDNGKLHYEPAANYNGSDSFTYKVSDGSLDSDNSATVSIDVKAVNDGPQAKDLTGENDHVTTPEDTPKSITLEASDADSSNLSFEVVNGPNNGTLSGNGANLTYTPDHDYNGLDAFAFKVCDDSTPEPLCDTGDVHIEVTPVNDDPQPQADSYTTNEDQPLTVNAADGVLANDNDSDGDGLTASLKSGPAHGSLTLNPDGSFTYTPDANYNGSDSFTYTVSDGAGGAADAVVTVTIHAVNDGPQAKDLTGEGDHVTTPEDTPKSITLEASDVDSSGLTFSIVGDGPSNGTLSGNGANLTYTPDKDYNGPDSFSFRVCDDSTPQPLCDTGDVSIEVTPVNDDPVAEDDAATVNEDNPVNINVLANDTDPDGAAAQNLDPSTVNVVDGPQHGTATVNPNGTITYGPDANFNGTDTFTYKVCDNDAACSNLATVRMTIRSVNDSPIVKVTRVTDGASYEKGQVPDPGCRVNDVEDGIQNVNPTLSSITGPLAQYGLGQQTATCSYTDQDGKKVTSQATFTIQDTTRPKVEWVKRIDLLEPSNAHGLPHARATFSEDMDPSTINTRTVTLVKKSTGQQIKATVRYDVAKRKAILIPYKKLVLGAKYIATVKGGPNGVTDVAGNLLDPDGDQVWVFTVREANR